MEGKDFELKDVNDLAQTQSKSKPLFSNKVQRNILIVIDVCGLIGFLVYCYYINSYFSVFYLVMLLLLILLTWQTHIQSISYFASAESNSKKQVNVRTFISEYQTISASQGGRKSVYQFEESDVLGNSMLSDNEEFQYKPLYWFTFSDLKKYIWISILVVSIVSIITKTVLVILLATSGNQIMNCQNYYGLEIEFNCSDNIISNWDYIKIFVPNGFIILFCCLVMAFRRVNNKANFETYREDVNHQIFNFYTIIIWILLFIMVCTSYSMIGYGVFFYQFAFTVRIFSGKEINAYDKFIIRSLKYLLLILIVTLYLASTAYFSVYQISYAETSQFIGANIFYFLITFNQWNSYIFICSALILFTILCILSEYLASIERRDLLRPAILECCQHFDAYKVKREQLNKLKYAQDSEYEQLEEDEEQKQQQNEPLEQEIPVEKQFEDQPQAQILIDPEVNRSSLTQSELDHQQVWLKKVNEVVLSFGVKVKQIVDQPIVTLRFLQITCIVIIIMLKTYESLMLMIWVLISGFTLSRRVNSITALLFALPSLLANFISFYYESIPVVYQEGYNEICPSDDKICQQFGFRYREYPFILLMIINISFFGFLLFLKQVQEEALKLITRVKQIKKKKEKPGWWTIFLIIIVRSSYIVSLLIVFYAGFLYVNIIQFILILFLLVFLINDSTMCAYKRYCKKTRSYQEIIVPFAFKYWILFVIYMAIILLGRYIYILFYQESKDSDWLMVMIGIDNQQQKQDISFWALFYFVALQYDSYKTKTYLKYQNQLFDLVLIQLEKKDQIGNVSDILTRIQLLFMKIVIWLSFIVNLSFLIFQPFSYINSVLLLLVGAIFIYYSISFTSKVNFRVLTNIWYVYLNILIITFIIRYMFQFLCLSPQVQNPDPEKESAPLLQLYDAIQYKYQQYGLYMYNTQRLRIEYFPDIFTIFLGALALNTYRILLKSQQSVQLDFKQRAESLDSQVSQQQNEDKLLDKVKRQEIEQYAKIMQISILEDWKWLKRPILIFAQLNTDLITLYIVISVVFYINSIAAFIILILYLSYFLIVHNELLNIMRNNQLLNKLEAKVKQLHEQYIDYQPVDRDNTIRQLQLLVSSIKIKRLKTRIDKKKTLWKLSFSFTALCIYLTYISQYLSLPETKSQLNQDLALSMFLFGTYAQETTESSCFCGKGSPGCSSDVAKSESDIFSAIIFFLILLFANVIDAGCTEILEDELKRDNEAQLKEEQEIVLNQKEKRQRARSLMTIKEEDEVQDDDQSVNPLEQIEKQDLEEYLKQFPFFSYKIISETPEEINQEEIYKQGLIINHFNNKTRILALKLSQGGFIILQRFLILILLFNTLLVNNIFSLIYLIMATYLFKQKTGTTNIKILNTFSVFAIWFQYVLLLLNYGPDADKIPSQSKITNFSVVNGLTDYWQSYLGFSTGAIMDCSVLQPLTPLNPDIQRIFVGTPCEKNNFLLWVFIINTLVLSLIYIYFLIVQSFSNTLLQRANEMEYDLQYTIDILTTLKSKYTIEIKLDYQSWKTRSYTFLHSTIQQALRNNHMIIVAFVLLLAQSNRVIFNLIELVCALLFFVMTEFYFKYPKTARQNSFEQSYFRYLFFIPVFTIASYTILKIPYLLNLCGGQLSAFDITNQEFYPQEPALTFVCAQIFQIRITGMVWIMFFISLYQDIESSGDYKGLLSQLEIVANQKARMVSLALAYASNLFKYKGILEVQEQKAIFTLIQSKAQEKLQQWHEKLIDKEAMERKVSEQAVQEAAQEELQKQESINEVKVLEPSEKKEELTNFQKQLISVIQYLQTTNEQYKYMGQPNLMDYILSQNRLLNRRIEITLEEFLRQEFNQFQVELDFLDTFYKLIYKQIQLKRSTDVNISQILADTIQIINTKKQQSPLQRKGTSSIMQSFLQSRKRVEMDIPELKIEEEHTYEQFQKSTELTFVKIVDTHNIVIINTKFQSTLPSLTTSRLVIKVLQEIMRLIVSNWKSFCYFLIIMYYTKNTGLLGALLPLLLFTWVLIDEKVTSQVFWIISYVVMSVISIVIFIYSMYGFIQLHPEMTENTPWYYPLYDSDSSLVFEIILIWVVVIQIYLSKKSGLYYQSLQDRENIFQGYIRMKINKFSSYLKKQIMADSQAQYSNLSGSKLVDEGAKQELVSQEEHIEQDIQEEQVNLNSEQSNQVEDPLIYKAKNSLEKRILDDPGLLSNQYEFLDRIFSHKFSRPGIDLYTLTAFIQILTIIYTILFFTSMVNDGTNINNIIKYNQIPGSLIWALLLQIIVMVFERYITLRDSVQLYNEESTSTFLKKYKLQFLMKYALQLVLVIIVFWFVFIHMGKPWFSNPDITSTDTTTAPSQTHNFRTNGYVNCFFLLYCAYFVVSALQLRFGYKQLKLRNTFLRQYNTVSNLFAKVFYAIPFLYELKVLMDWTFLPTSLDIFQWFKLEDIHGMMYFTKVQSKGYIDRPLGERQSKIMKCGMGCTFVLFILICILGPLILFSTLNPSTQLNLVNGGEFELSLSNENSSLSVQLYSTNQLYGIEKLLTSQAQINAAFNETVKNQIINTAPSTGALQSFQLISFSNYNWDISQPLYNQLTDQMQSFITGINPNAQFILNFTFTFTRQEEKILPTKNQFSYPGNPLLATLQQNQAYLNVSQVENLYTSITTCKPYPLLMENFYVESMQLYSPDGTTFKPRPITGNGVNSVSNAQLQFNCGTDVIKPLEGNSWWSLLYEGSSQQILTNDGGLVFFIVSDKFSPLTYGFSIITIYTSVILLIGTYIRGLFSGQIWLLEYQGMVYPDDLIMICEAISIARSQKDFKKENLLYFELIDILRSPEIVKVMTGSWATVFKDQEKIKLD